MIGLYNGIKAILENFATIVQGIKMAIKFLVNIVESTFQLSSLLAKIYGNLLTLLGTMPTWLVTFGTLAISISILYAIIGRETGK